MTPENNILIVTPRMELIFWMEISSLPARRPSRI